MANYLDTLLGRIDDPDLAAALTREVERLRDQRQFGLVFERHLPERVRLYSHPIRRGVTVQLKAETDGPVWMVQKVSKGHAHIARLEGDDQLEEKHPVSDLVVVREFGQPIYPGLKSVGKVERGGDKPFHTVINAENFHALETLLYAYEGQVDCIYIDPPYNSGARDWKYNNDYVDGNDQYRHSKWLSFMERRLTLASRLLSPEGVLIVAIDEHESARLGVMLEQMFPSKKTQMVTVVINPKGVTQDGISRVDEYLYFVMPAGFAMEGRGDDLLTPGTTDEDESIVEVGGKPRWQGLLHSGQGCRRQDRPNMFYPVLIDEDRGAVVGAGEPLLEGDPDLDAKIDGLTAVWPIRSDGSWGRWYVSHTTLRDFAAMGYVALGGKDEARKTWALSYPYKKIREQVQSGVISIVRFDEVKNVVEMQYEAVGVRRIKTVWHRSRHDAGAYGSDMLANFLGSRAFPFPKSLYAVFDALYPVLRSRPNALVLDFFAGSGTTAHAVALLNATDSGTRRSISVTNNEVSEEDAKALREKGVEPGSAEWESLGIFEAVTKPRLESAVTGLRQSGETVPGTYIGGARLADGFEENVEFLELTYQDRDHVSLGHAFAAIAPLLWLKAGAQGPRIDRLPEGEPWALPADGTYGILFEPNAWRKFVKAVDKHGGVRHVFVVTDAVTAFQQVLSELPAGVEATMLYEDYLSTFEINTGLGAE